MIEFLKRLFGQSGSSATAKERLRFVLMTDHLALAPEMIETLKADLVDVISRYVEVDRDRIDVNFEQQDTALAMLANIPIISVNRPNGNGATGTGATAVRRSRRSPKRRRPRPSRKTPSRPTRRRPRRSRPRTQRRRSANGGDAKKTPPQTRLPRRRRPEALWPFSHR